MELLTWIREKQGHKYREDKFPCGYSQRSSRDHNSCRRKHLLGPRGQGLSSLWMSLEFPTVILKREEEVQGLFENTLEIRLEGSM